MPFTLSASILTNQRERILPLSGILKRWLLWLFFAALSTSCQSQKLQLPPQNSQDCGKEIPCKKGEDVHRQSCPEGLPPAPCPPGTFFSSESPHNSLICHKCPRGFFNHWPGQDACFPCGSEAMQPEEGQDTCICRGSGRMFQPSDGQCPCFPGYQDVGEPYGCVQKEYGICRNGATRNQEGQCLTKGEWTNHCAQEVCATPGDVRGYDSVLGLCLCWGMDLNGECGPPCQERQRHILQLTCHEGIPRISSIDDDGNQLSYFLDKPLSPRAVGFPCISEHNQESSPVYVVRTDGHGFLGLTRPGPELFYPLHQPLGNTRPPAQVPDSSSEASSDENLSFLWALNLSSKEPGILNPTACIHTHDTIAFLVTREHYPEYDLSHLYNTPDEYDWGDFRALAEDSRLSLHNTFLFLHQFQQPGVYVFRLSSNRHRKMYIRALQPGGQCFGDGPFVPTTPRYLIQTGIAKTPTPQKKPDWPVVLGLIFLLLGLCLLLLAQSHNLGWARKSTPCPLFRMHQQKYNMETYSSPGTLLTSVKQSQAGQDFPIPRTGSHGGCWEAKEQLDLERFDTSAFFKILQRHSLSVTAKLSQTKEELKLLYLKLIREASSLRELWHLKLRIPAANDLLLGSIQKEQQQTAQATAREAEEEARRRQGLADEYAESLTQQLKLLRQDLRARELEWAAFSSALKEVQRLLTAKTEPTSEKASQPVQDPDRKSPQVDAAIDHLSQVLLSEGQRLKAWGILGTGTGAELLQSGDTSEVPDITCMKPTTRILVPGPNCAMLSANGCPRPIPPGYFIHPGTGRLLPEAGNLGYDLLNATLVPTTDVTAGGVRTSKSPILPYVSYPICPVTNTPTTTYLPTLQPNRASQLGVLMTDPVTGLEVPVLAVTFHPETGQWLAIGGTYRNPLTKTLAPIEMGGPMEDPITGSISPILGVGLDENTGEVLVLGGLRDISGSLLLPGDCFVEPLSGKSAWLRGACLQKGQIVPHAGGPQALLDANVLAAQMHMMKVLQQIQKSPEFREQGKMEAAAKDLKQSLSLSLYHLLYQVQRLERQLKATSGIKATGGKMGMIQYPGTEVWIPAVFGMEIPDPAGSGLLVPILGMKCNWNSGQFTPLAGTMEDADGKGLIPISIGARTIDFMTGEPGPVIGAQIDSSVGVVVPIVQVLGVLPRGIEDSNLTVLLEKELSTRELYWCHQWEDEEQLMENLEALSQEFLETHNWDTLTELLPQNRLRGIEQICCDLESSSLQEAQRRARVLMPYPLKLGLLIQDKEEWEQEAQVALGVRRVLQDLGQAMEKLRQEGGRLHGQEKELWRQQSKYQTKQSWHGTRKVALQLSGEVQALVRETQRTLDGAMSQLQYIRDLNRLQLLQNQILISRIPVCLENYPGGKFYGEDAASLRDGAVACPLLIPLLKSFTQMLKGTQSHCPVFGDQGQETDGNKVQCLWTLPLLSLLKTSDSRLQACQVGAELAEQLYPKPGNSPPYKDLRSVFQRHSYPQASQKSKLVPVQPSDLSAREFVIYQHGLSTLQFLTRQIKAPEITLHIASNLPAIHAPGNAFHKSFFYQKDQNKLFILRECLASVGNFTLLLIHCLAHITAADLYQDSNPVFLKLFYEGLKACLSDAFSVKLQMSAVFQDKKSDQCITAVLLKEEPTSEERDLLSKLIDTKVKFYMDPESPEESMKKNKYHLLFTNFEHLLKNKLSLEHRILTEENTTLGINKSSEAKSLPHFNPQEKEELDSLMQQLTKFLEKEDDI